VEKDRFPTHKAVACLRGPEGQLWGHYRPKPLSVTSDRFGVAKSSLEPGINKRQIFTLEASDRPELLGTSLVTGGRLRVDHLE
jgi:hypothetical protein